MQKLLTHRNNFNFLRLFFSSAVIISHSFPLTGNKEWFTKITNDQLDLGSLAVNVFFIVSGYLIFNSLRYSSSATNYVWKRILRLFPALFIVLFLTLFAIAFVYAGRSIFTESSFYSYLPNNLTLYNAQFIVKGVFEQNPYPTTINGSLWSLCYEFTMYIIILVFFPVRKNKKLTAVLLSLLYLLFLYGYFLGPPEFVNILIKAINLDPLLFCKLGIFFFAGSLLSFFPLNKINKNYISISLVVLLFIAITYNRYIIASFVFLPILILLIGTSFSHYLEYIPSKIGDISYGTYIYGFVVQQILMNYLNLNPLGLILISLPITYLFAYFSWHLIESTTLRYKNFIK